MTNVNPNLDDMDGASFNILVMVIPIILFDTQRLQPCNIWSHSLDSVLRYWCKYRLVFHDFWISGQILQAPESECFRPVTLMTSKKPVGEEYEKGFLLGHS